MNNYKEILIRHFVNNTKGFITNSLMPAASHVYRLNSMGGCSTLARVVLQLIDYLSINI
jgi:hypothetical protein